MVTNFENITYDLTKQELDLVPIIVSGMQRYMGNEHAIKGPKIVEGLKISNPKSKCTEARLRKIVNYIRAKGIAPIMATSKGYYWSTNKDEIKKQIQSLNERANGILAAANGLKSFLES